MEIYKRETAEILRRHRAGEITRKQCIAALNSATAALVPFLVPDTIQQAQEAVNANDEILAAISGPRPTRKPN